jgi:tetratricopeptide (TPR) repeat protein
MLGLLRSTLLCLLLLAVSALASGCTPQAGLEDVRRLHEAGHFAASIEPLRGLLEETPDDSELNHLYGLALLESGQPELAIWPLRKAVQHPDRAVEDGLLLARALLRGGSSDDAIQTASQVLEIAPNPTPALRLLLEARLAARQHEEALEDAARLLELEPDDAQALLARLMALLALDRADEAEQALAAARAALESPDGADEWQPRLCGGAATFLKEKGEPAAAEEAWNECLETFPTDPVVVFGGVEFFAERSAHARCLEILRRAHDEAPTELQFIVALAYRLAAYGQSEEAERLLLAATTDGVNDRQAWFRLAAYHEERNEPAEARDAMKRGLQLTERVTATTLAAFVDLLIRAGDYAEAEELMAELAGEQVISDLLRGRLLLARGRPAEALAALDAGLHLWPNNSVARWLAGQAAEQLGDFDRALAEYLESLRSDPGNREAVRSMLRLLEALGLYREAGPILSRYRREQPRDPEMLVQSIRFASRADQPDIVERALQRLSRFPGQRGVAEAELAAIRVSQDGVAAGVESIRSAKLDLTHPINGPALDALVAYLIDTGQPDEALKAVDAALAAHPDQALFLELRGQALRAAGEPDAARAALERALAVEPERASALAALAELAAERGEREVAIALYDRADRADPEEPFYAWQAIQLLAAADDAADPEPRLEALLVRHPTHAATANLLARRLLERDPERAFDLARRAVRCGGGPDALDTLGRIQLARGEAERAAQTLGVSLELRPDSPSNHYWLGRALSAAGDTEGARRALGVALQAESFPEREAAQAQLAGLSVD